MTVGSGIHGLQGSLDSKRVRVIVVTHNSMHDIQVCISSLLSQKGITLEIVVVDNASIDGTPEYIKSEYGSQIRLVPLSKNIGYAGGCNSGLWQPLPDYIVFLNADTEGDEWWLHNAISVMDLNPSCGACQPVVLLYDKRNLLNTRGNESNFLFIAWPDGFGEKWDSNERVRRIAFASGCAAIYRKQVLEDIGGFDESYFMYCEDLDLGLRAFLFGYDTLLSPLSIVYHKYNPRLSGTKYYLLERNRIMTLFKIYRVRTLTAILPVFLLTESALLAKSFLEGWAVHKLKCYAYLVRNLPLLMERRRQTQRIRVREDTDLLTMLSGAVEFSGIPSTHSFEIGNSVFEKYLKFLRTLKL